MLWTAARRGRLALVRWLAAQGADVEIPRSAVHVTHVMVSPYCIAVRSRWARGRAIPARSWRAGRRVLHRVPGSARRAPGAYRRRAGERAVTARGLPPDHSPALCGGRRVRSRRAPVARQRSRFAHFGPLHSDRTIAELLVAGGFDLNVPIRDQETPLTMACRADKAEHPAVVAALLELGADPNAKNARGRTPLAVATSARFDRTVALLRAAGAR
jgi:hypothetical protein